MIVGVKDLKRQLVFKSNNKKINRTGDLTYMPCSAPAPPTMAVKELDLQTI